MNSTLLIKRFFLGSALCLFSVQGAAMKFEIPKGLESQAESEAQSESEPKTDSDAGASEGMRFDSVPQSAAQPGSGNVSAAKSVSAYGRVVDQTTTEALSGVAILLEGTDIGTLTDADGEYRLENAPPGIYTLSFIKSGYIEANVTEFEITAEAPKEFNFALPPRPTEMSDSVYELQDFSVTAEEANQMMMNIDLRMGSDSIMNVMSSEDFSRFAASDVGDAIKRVAGVTVEGGKFAVIRGLDERYSSTLLNGAPVPSPDPDRQSVPLDLFPSEIVSNLTLSKTFTPDLPGNSAGGSINIITNVFPEEFEISVTGKGGYNDLVEDRFIERQGPSAREIPFGDLGGSGAVARDLSSAGVVAGSGKADLETEFGLDAGGTFEWFNRRFRFLTSLSRETDFSTLEGTEESRFAYAGRSGVLRPLPPFLGGGYRFEGTGDLAKGELSATGGRFDITESERSERTTFLFATEVDIDTEGDHRIGMTYFWNEVESETAALRENGTFPGFAPGTSAVEFARRSPFDGSNFLGELANPSIGILPVSTVDAFLETRLFGSSVVTTERELEVFQISGSHNPSNFFEKLELTWGFSQAEATQTDNDAIVIDAIQKADGEFHTGQVQGVTLLQPSFSWRRVFEDQEFFRVDGKYEFELGENLTFTPSFGLSRERTTRETDQFFVLLRLNQFGVDNGGDTFEEAARKGIRDPAVFAGGGLADATAYALGERDIDAHHFGGKLTFFEKLDVFGGFRFEKVKMSTSTNADAGSNFFNFELFRDNANPNSATPQQAQINTQILGINGGRPLSNDFVGEIDEDVALPSLGITYRPIEGARISLVYSETLVRPSFKEFTELTVQNPLTLDYEAGNPALTTSDVRSIDFRVEYAWGRGDLVALSLFHKEIDNPIEKTTMSGGVPTDVYFNNPNSAEIKGVEFEFRKRLDFLGSDFLEYFSVGGNLALIEASVGIPESFRQLLSGGFTAEIDGNPQDIGGAAYAEQTNDPNMFDGVFLPAPSERVLFQQPEWIGNLDLSFEHPEWGTRATLSVFAQSEVLDTAGGYLANEQWATVDEFNKSFYEVNLTFSQRINKYFTAGFSIKNLTNSERGIEFDDSVGGGSKRSYRVGRDYSIFITASF